MEGDGVMRVAIILALAAIATAAVMSQRGYRKCMCHRPRHLFPSVAARRRHETIYGLH